MLNELLNDTFEKVPDEQMPVSHINKRKSKDYSANGPVDDDSEELLETNSRYL